MWQNRKAPKKVLTLILTPTRLTCGVISSVNTLVKPFQLEAYRVLDLKNTFFYQGAIHNPTILTQMIQDFLKQHHYHNLPVSWAISGSCIFENIQTLPTASATLEQVNIPKAKNLFVDFRYIAPHAQDGFDFYVCGIKQERLFQYQLFAMNLNLSLRILTTPYIAHMHAYRHQFGDAFRQTQLMVDAARVSHNFEHYFTPDFVTRSLEFSPALALDLKKEAPHVATSLGLYLAGKKEYEHH